VSTRHNPEFTILEFYQAYADYGDLMELTEALFAELAQSLLGRLALTWGSTPWISRRRGSGCRSSRPSRRRSG